MQPTATKPRPRLANADYPAQTLPANGFDTYSTRRRDLEEKLPVYLAAGGTMSPSRIFGADDALTLDGMPGVSVPLGPIFARALG